jgi:hypothetical protein
VTSGEIPLTGGNMTGGVVRLGDTVRRPAGPWTPAVHALLDHVYAAGFRGAPRPLGLDDKGREVLTFVPGTVVWPQRMDLVGPADRLRRVAALIRDLHDAVEGFTPPPDARWQVLIPAEGAGIIAHHDLAPWNLSRATVTPGGRMPSTPASGRRSGAARSLIDLRGRD